MLQPGQWHGPDHRHDSKVWERDPQRGLRGETLRVSGGLIAMKADGSEYAHSFNSPLSAHFDHPCFKCRCTAGPSNNVGAVDDISAVQLPRQERTPDDYEDSVGNPKQWRSSRPIKLANVGCATKRPPRYDANIGDLVAIDRLASFTV